VTSPRLPFTLRATLRLCRVVVSLLGAIAPAAMRGRWTEEWHAEIEHAAARLASRRWASVRLARFLAGTAPDAAHLRRLARTPAQARPRPSWFSWLHALGQDVQHGARAIAAARGFTATIVASLSLGIAANAVAFAFLDAVLFPRFSGVADQDRLVHLTVERNCGGGRRCYIQSSTFDDYRVLAGAIPGLDGLSASALTPMSIGARGRAIAVSGTLVSANYFDVLGVRLPLGRPFSAREEQPAEAAVAVIGHSLWHRVFGGVPSALGEFITVGGHSVRIVGVAPEGFGGVKRRASLGGPEIWLPSGMADRVGIPEGSAGSVKLPANEFSINYVGRLSAGSSVEEISNQAQVAAARMAAARPDGQHGAFANVTRVGVRYAAGILDEIAAIMLVPLLVLLIGCINAANLLLARGSRQVRDTAVRLALGASRWRIVRQLLVESVLLALLSAAATLPLVAWMLAAIQASVPIPLAIDASVVLYTVAASLASVVGFGLVPALRMSSARPGAALGSSRTGEDRPRSRMRQGLVVAQVALSLGLLATGGQLVTGVKRLNDVTGAQDPARLLMVSFDLAQLKMAPSAAESFYQQLLERVRRLPGVERAGLTHAAGIWTFGGRMGAVNVWPPGVEPKDGRTILGGFADGDLFEAVGLRLIRGRLFQPEDRVDRPRVAIVSRATSDRFFKGSALGQVIRVAASGQRYPASQEVQIVGVIEPALDPNYVRTPDMAIPSIYLPARLQHEPALTLYIRAKNTPSALLPAIRDATDAIDSRVPFTWTGTLAERRYDRESESRLAAQGVAALGVIALLLACGGLYGVVSFFVSTRRREIGVRMALGAHPRGILELVMKQAMRMALLGAAIGGSIAIVLSGVLRASMHGIPALDPAAFALTALILVGAMLLAGLVPARRAARVDPIVVLRDE
jgi:predicted permease